MLNIISTIHIFVATYLNIFSYIKCVYGIQWKKDGDDMVGYTWLWITNDVPHQMSHRQVHDIDYQIIMVNRSLLDITSRIRYGLYKNNLKSRQG